MNFRTLVRFLFCVIAIFSFLTSPLSALQIPELERTRALLELNPRDVAAWNAYGIEQAKAEDVTGAIRTWRKALDIDPRYVHLYNNIGSALRRLGYWKESEQWYRASLQLQPTFWTWYNLGLLLEETKKYPEAVTAFNTAISLNPTFTLAQEHSLRLQKFLYRVPSPAPGTRVSLPPVTREEIRVPTQPPPEVVSPIIVEPAQPKRTRREDPVKEPERDPAREAPLPPIAAAPDGKGAPVFFTFDGGAEADGIPEILSALGERKIRATFFLTGKWVENYPDLAIQVLAAGHEIANHGMNHKDMSKWDKEAIAAELGKTEEVFQRVLGRPGIRYFRFPFGAQNARVEKIVKEIGYYSVYWDIDTLDWKEPSVASIISKVRQKMKGGSVILMHCGSKTGSRALSRVLDEALQRGYKPIPLSTFDPKQIAAIPVKP